MALETVLVPYDGSEEADAMLRFACNVVVGRRRVIALYVQRVHRSLPLDPLPSWFDRDGNRALDHAEAVAWHHGVSIETALIRARQPAEAIAGEARSEGADAILLPLGKQRWPWQHWLLPSLARTVMRKAPCPVLLGRQPSLVYEPPWPMGDLRRQATPPSPPMAQSSR